MNLIKLSSEHVINLDHVVSMQIIDIPDEQGNLSWAIMFQMSLIDFVKVVPHSPDEDEYETSHCQIKEYTYACEVSPFYKSLEEAERELDKIKKWTEIKNK